MKKQLTILLLLVSLMLSGEVLKIGVYQNSPKISFNQQTSKAEGIFADVINEIALNENWEIEYIPGIWEDQLRSLEEGKIDVLLDVFASPERMEKFNFNKISLIDSWLEVFALQDLPVTSIKDLSGKRVAVLKSSIQESYLQNEIKGLWNIDFTLLTYPDYEATQKAVLTGKADLLVSSRFFFFSEQRDEKIVSKHIIFCPSGTFIAFNKSVKPEIIQAIDNNIGNMKNNPQSTYYRSLNRNLELTRSKSIPLYVYSILVILAAIIATLSVFHILLNRKVAKKTAELKASEAHTRALLEINPDLIFIIDRNGVYLDCHTSSTELLYAPWSELAGKRVQDILPSAVANALLHKIEAVINTKQLQTLEYELTILGQRLFFEARILAFENDKIMIISRDVTERNKLEEKLRRSQKMEAIGIITAGIAHEINSPMQYILDNTIFLKDNTGSFIKQIRIIKDHCNNCSCPECIVAKEEIAQLDVDFLSEEIPKSVEATLNGISKIQNIVASLKDFAYPRNYTLSATDINKAIDHILVITAGSWKHCAEIQRNFAPNLPLISCYADELNQVLINLIINATDAIKEKQFTDGKITISTALNDNFVQISIADNGNGMLPEIKEHIFEQFFTTKEVGKGTGQGLAIVYDIITNLHKGSIEVQSTIGVGTEFIITLHTEGESHA